jgi:hypothetical protein
MFIFIVLAWNLRSRLILFTSLIKNLATVLLRLLGGICATSAWNINNILCITFGTYWDCSRSLCDLQESAGFRRGQHLEHHPLACRRKHPLRQDAQALSCCSLWIPQRYLSSVSNVRINLETFAFILGLLRLALCPEAMLLLSSTVDMIVFVMNISQVVGCGEALYTLPGL